MNGRPFGKVLQRGLWLLSAFTGLLAASPDDARLDQLLEQLGAEEFAERRAAQEELVVWGKKDLEKRTAFLQEKQEAAEDPEVRERCRIIVKELAMEIIERNRPGFIGIRMGGIFLGPGQREPVPDGIPVVEVIAGTAAEKFGLQQGDVILRIDDLDVTGPSGTTELQTYVSGKVAGTEINLEVMRGVEKIKLPLTLMKRPWDATLRERVPFDNRFHRPPTVEEMQELEYQKWLKESKKRSKSGP